MPRKLSNWLASYLEYTSGQESPKEFHRWIGLAVVSATLGRHVYLPRGYYTLYPNLYIILVAGSAKCKKSTSTGMGIDLLKNLKSPPMIFSQKITAEALIQALCECKIDNQCAGIIYASELSVFMGGEAVRSGLIPALTDLYDNPDKWAYHTRGRGVEQLVNVSIGMLAASTLDWIKSSIPEDAIGGGFTSRLIFVYQERPSRPVLFPEMEATTIELKKNLIADLNHIRDQRGVMSLTPEAMDFAKRWYDEEMSTVRDGKLEGYYGRKHDTMFKIAMLLSLCESDERWVHITHVKEALRLLDSNEGGMHEVIGRVTASIAGNTTDKVLEIVKRAGKIHHSELLKKCWRFASAMEMQEHLRTLIEGGLISENLDKDNRTRYYMLKRQD